MYRVVGISWHLWRHPMDPFVNWRHRCIHTGNVWRVLRARISAPCRDEWVRQAELPGSVART